MKKLTEVLGLKLMGIKEGQESGVVQDIMVDPETRSATYVVLKGSTGYGFYAIPFGDVTGFGTDYMVTSTIRNAVKIYESQELLRIMENGFFLAGATAVSSAGNVMGSVSDFGFDTKTGKIGEILLDSGIRYELTRTDSLVGKLVFIHQDEEEPDQPESADSTDSETRQFLLGKAVTDDLVSDDGLFSIEKGTVLTEQILEEAEAHDMLLTLTLNV